MGEGSPVNIIYSDFQKAFDKVPHQRLIFNLKPQGIGISIINWIEQRLTVRRQRAVVDGEVSIWKPYVFNRFLLVTTRICTMAYLIFNIRQ